MEKAASDRVPLRCVGELQCAGRLGNVREKCGGVGSRKCYRGEKFSVALEKERVRADKFCGTWVSGGVRRIHMVRR